MSSKQVIKGPVITEKLTRLMEEENKYGFHVDMDANKVEIKQALQKRYPDVSIGSVRTMIVRNKAKRQYTRAGVVQGNRKYWKKAIVKVEEGEIDFFEHI